MATRRLGSLQLCKSSRIAKNRSIDLKAVVRQKPHNLADLAFTSGSFNAPEICNLVKAFRAGSEEVIIFRATLIQTSTQVNNLLHLQPSHFLYHCSFTRSSQSILSLNRHYSSAWRNMPLVNLESRKPTGTPNCGDPNFTSCHVPSRQRW
jgi:hypothetical protein